MKIKLFSIHFNFNSIFLGCFQYWKHETWETFPSSVSYTCACTRRNTFQQICSQYKTLLVRFNRRFVEYRWIFLLFPLQLHFIMCRFREVIVKIEKSQKLNLHLLHGNLILCHSYTVNISKFISIAVHKEIILFIRKGTWFLSLKLFLA